MIFAAIFLNILILAKVSLILGVTPPNENAFLPNSTTTGEAES